MSGRIPRNDSSEDEDEFLVPENSNTSAVSSRLGSLFSTPSKVDGNASLTYKAPKQPVLKEEPSDQPQKASATDADGVPVRVLHPTTAHAFLLKDGQYASQGKIGVAVLGNRLKKDYKILLYLSNKQPIGQATVTPSLDVSASANNYVSFVDDRSLSWSLAFESETQLLEFLKWILAIKGLLADEHHKEIMMLNMEEGEGNPVGEGDSLEIEYTEFIVEDGPAITEFNGNLNSNQKPLRVKLGKGEAPKGWMDGLLGMKKRGKRIFVIPPDLGYSGHDSSPSFPTNTPLMVYAVVKRVKFSKKRSETGTNDSTSERKLSTGSTVSSNVDVSMSASSMPVSEENRVDENGPQKSASESDVHKKADLVHRMARIGHAVMGATPQLPPVAIEVHDHGTIAPNHPASKPVAPPRPSTLQQNPLAVVCADMSLARPIVTQTTAVTKSSSDGSISPRSRSSLATTTAVTQVHSVPHTQPAFESNMIPNAFPALPASNSAMPYMYPFPYPPQSYFLQPPFMPPLPTSDFSSMASSATTSAEKQAILDEIHKCHLHLQDALTKTLVTNLNGMLKKFTDVSAAIESKLAEPKSHESSPSSEARDANISSSISSDTLALMMSKLDQIDATIRGYSSSDREGTSNKTAELGEQQERTNPGAEMATQSKIMDRIEALGEKVSSVQAAIEKVNSMHAELTAANEWKEKYEKLKSQALSMREQYEERIQELEERMEEKEAGGGSDVSEREKVKKIMSTFYRNVSQRFPSGEQFDSAAVRQIIMDAVKESTLNVLTNAETEGNIEAVQSVRSHDSSPSEDHKDESPSGQVIDTAANETDAQDTDFGAALDSETQAKYEDGDESK